MTNGAWCQYMAIHGYNTWQYMVAHGDGAWQFLAMHGHGLPCIAMFCHAPNHDDVSKKHQS